MRQGEREGRQRRTARALLLTVILAATAWSAGFGPELAGGGSANAGGSDPDFRMPTGMTSALRPEELLPEEASPSPRDVPSTRNSPPSAPGERPLQPDTPTVTAPIDGSDRRTQPPGQAEATIPELPVQQFLHAPQRITEARPTEVPAPEALAGLATGDALNDLLATADEFIANEWKQSGEVEIVGVEADVSGTVDGIQTRTLTLCIDSSAVSISDANGDEIREPAPPGTIRALNIFELQLRDGQWLVSTHTFPDDANC